MLDHPAWGKRRGGEMSFFLPPFILATDAHQATADTIHVLGIRDREMHLTMAVWGWGGNPIGLLQNEQ